MTNISASRFECDVSHRFSNYSSGRWSPCADLQKRTIMLLVIVADDFVSAHSAHFLIVTRNPLLTGLWNFTFQCDGHVAEERRFNVYSSAYYARVSSRKKSKKLQNFQSDKNSRKSGVKYSVFYPKNVKHKQVIRTTCTRLRIGTGQDFSGVCWSKSYSNYHISRTRTSSPQFLPFPLLFTSRLHVIPFTNIHLQVCISASKWVRIFVNNLHKITK